MSTIPEPQSSCSGSLWRSTNIASHAPGKVNTNNFEPIAHSLRDPAPCLTRSHEAHLYDRYVLHDSSSKRHEGEAQVHPDVDEAARGWSLCRPLAQRRRPSAHSGRAYSKNCELSVHGMPHIHRIGTRGRGGVR